MDDFSFLPRKDILDLLDKRVRDFKDGYRQNIALLGDGLIGKTTLLKQFLDRFQDDKIISVYVDIAPFEFALFVKRFINSLLYHFLKNQQLISSREEFQLLLKMAKERLPQTGCLLEQIALRCDREKPETIFKELFTALDVFAQETQKQCVIIFDEFHHLKKIGAKNICQELGKRIMYQKNTLFIFSSSSCHEAKEILVNDLSLLFGNFETIELQAFSAATSLLLIQQVLADIFVPKEYTDFLIHFTGGHPFYLHIICQELHKLCQMGQKEFCDKKILIHALENLLFQEWGTLNMKFSAQLAQISSERHRHDFWCCLDAIALGKNRIKDLTPFLKKTQKELSIKLNRLAEAGLVTKNGSFYSCNDRVMSFWLKFVHYEKFSALSPDYREQSGHFRHRIQTEIEDFILHSKTNIAERMLELFNQFEGDDIHVDRKRFRLAPYRDLKLLTFDNTNLKIGLWGKTHDSFLLAAIKEDGIHEHDVNEFIQLAKKFKHKTIDKIIIGLGDIERNARLLAKDSHITTWDTRNVNVLLDLFGKPRIVK
ncbi:MAG: ATP-binding protein [Candidatus Omnitrophota bacterium]